MKELTNEQLIERIQSIRNKLYSSGRQTPTRSMINEQAIERYSILNKRYLNMTFIYHMRNKRNKHYLPIGKVQTIVDDLINEVYQRPLNGLHRGTVSPNEYKEVLDRIEERINK